VFDAQGEGVRLQIDLLSWSENALELAEAMATGIQVWPADPEQLFRRSA
jgi:hypothetical protein